VGLTLLVLSLSPPYTESATHRRSIMGDAGRVVALASEEAEAERTRAELAVRGIHAEMLHADAGTYELEDDTLREHVVASEGS